MKSDKKTVLVTGGAGYVGSVLIGLLLENAYNVVAFDNLSFGGESLLGALCHSRFKFIKGDIASSARIKAVFDDYKIDSVVHLAAIVGDPACTKQPKLAENVNWKGSLGLLEESLKKGIKRFIFSSTCSNYGKMADPSGYVNESSTLLPISLYAKLKVKFENVILNELEKKENFSPVSLRSATVYGPSPRMRFDLTVNEFTKELALGRELEVFGEQFWRPYCHVYDFSRAILLVLEAERKKIAYDVFNAGDTRENYTKQMITEEIKKLIPDAKIKYVRKDEDPRDYRVSFDKIRKRLGFSVSRRLGYGIKEVKRLIDEGIIRDPDSVRYRNS